MIRYQSMLLLFIAWFAMQGGASAQETPYEVGACTACQPLGYERLTNGDFNAGDTGFTSALSKECACTDGTYCVVDVAAGKCADFANIASPDNSQYLVVQAADVDGEALWSQSLLLLENQEYQFSFDVRSGLLGGTNAELRVLVDGVVVESGISPSPDVWTNICLSLTSVNEGVSTISITQNNPTSSTNNYGLDNISLKPIYSDAIPCELIVAYVPGTSQATKAALLEKYNASRKDECVCDDIDLWLINSFPIITPQGDTIIDMEHLRKKSQDEGDIETVDYNYITNNHSDMIVPPYSHERDVPAIPNGNCEVVVAVVDAGMDIGHQQLNGNIWDGENPCPDDAANGYNFADNNNEVDDNSVNGHGTHVGGIVRSYYTDNNQNQHIDISLIPVKVQNAQGKGTLFDVVCGTLFAAGNGADVINISLGYYGDSTQIMYNVMEHAKDLDEIVIVSSAGNSGKDNDIYGHYPSNHANPNLIAVAADTLSEGLRVLTPYSCYGVANVDISAEGHINSTLPGNNTGYLSGTSMAAPQVAAAAALAKQYVHDAATVKNAILTTGTANHNSSPSTLSNKRLNIPAMLNKVGRLPAIPCNAGTNPPGISIADEILAIRETRIPGRLRIEYKGKGKIESVKVLDKEGRPVRTEPYDAETSTIDVSGLPKGQYSVEVGVGGKTLTKEFTRK